MKTSMQQLLASISGARTEKWPVGERFAVGFSHGTMLVELYAPSGSDMQTPHVQDELYFIMRGRGEIVIAGQRDACAAGDAFSVTAGVPHRFENFSDDFATWVVFYGVEGGEK